MTLIAIPTPTAAAPAPADLPDRLQALVAEFRGIAPRWRLIFGTFSGIPLARPCRIELCSTARRCDVDAALVRATAALLSGDLLRDNGDDDDDASATLRRFTPLLLRWASATYANGTLVTDGVSALWIEVW